MLETEVLRSLSKDDEEKEIHRDEFYSTCSDKKRGLYSLRYRQNYCRGIENIMNRNPRNKRNSNRSHIAAMAHIINKKIGADIKSFILKD